MPSSAKRCLTVGVAMTAISACSSLSRICGGVPAGRNAPYQLSMTTLGKPSSLVVGRSGNSGVRSDANSASGVDRAGLHQRQQDRQVGIEHVDMAAEQIVDRRRRAAIGHVGDFHARRGVEHFHRDIHRRARSGRAVGELLRLRLGDEVFHVVDAELVVHHQQRRHGGDHHHRHEGFHRIVGRRRFEDRAEDSAIPCWRAGWCRRRASHAPPVPSRWRRRRRRDRRRSRRP